MLRVEGACLALRVAGGECLLDDIQCRAVLVGLRVSGSGLKVPGFGFRYAFGFRASGLGMRCRTMFVWCRGSRCQV